MPQVNKTQVAVRYPSKQERQASRLGGKQGNDKCYTRGDTLVKFPKPREGGYKLNLFPGHRTRKNKRDACSGVEGSGGVDGSGEPKQLPARSHLRKAGSGCQERHLV